ncbi:MAG: hypothetical protein VB015_02400 [Erysipelotrichaceae bacterium]|nr:hypothetical protein [Erysipelotrichaceae bacterium]
MIPLQEINEFLAAYGWIIAVAIAVILAITVLIILFLNKKKSSNNGGIIELIGGKDNIIEFSLKGSRLTVKVKDRGLIKNNELHNAGVVSVIETGEKIVLVLNSKTKNELEKKTSL